MCVCVFILLIYKYIHNIIIHFISYMSVTFHFMTSFCNTKDNKMQMLFIHSCAFFAWKCKYADNIKLICNICRSLNYKQSWIFTWVASTTSMEVLHKGMSCFCSLVLIKKTSINLCLYRFICVLIGAKTVQICLLSRWLGEAMRTTEVKHHWTVHSRPMLIKVFWLTVPQFACLTKK